jgi:hypothetical protein
MFNNLDFQFCKSPRSGLPSTCPEFPLSMRGAISCGLSYRLDGVQTLEKKAAALKRAHEEDYSVRQSHHKG